MREQLALTTGANTISYETDNGDEIIFSVNPQLLAREAVFSFERPSWFRNVHSQREEHISHALFVQLTYETPIFIHRLGGSFEDAVLRLVESPALPLELKIKAPIEYNIGKVPSRKSYHVEVGNAP